MGTESGKPHWSQGLLTAVKDPKKVIVEDDLTVVIKDLYPKATYHYLVCPKEPIISLKSIEIKHLSLLRHMHEVAENISGKHKGYKFLIGYHSVPSMPLLHLHVISDDFHSPYLKTKKHWNSFTTDYFVSSETLMKELEENGALAPRSTSKCNIYLKKKLTCHKCEFEAKHMPDLKLHLKKHLKQ